MIVVLLLLLGLIIAWLGWRRRRARGSEAALDRDFEDADNGDKLPAARAMTSEYASVGSVLGGGNPNMSEYGKAPNLPDVVYDEVI